MRDLEFLSHFFRGGLISACQSNDFDARNLGNALEMLLAKCALSRYADLHVFSPDFKVLINYIIIIEAQENSSESRGATPKRREAHMETVTTRDEKLFIKGRWINSVDSKTYEKKNPYTNRVTSQVAAGKREDARRAIDAAAGAFPAWSSTAPAVRRGLFLKAADILERRMPEIAKVMAEETGQTFGWGMFNCM